MAGLIAVLMVAVTVLVPAVGGAGPIHADVTLAEYFRLEWQPTPGAVSGYVANVSNLPVDRMQVLVERLDAAGTVVGSSRAWVMGVVAPQHRTYFTTRVPAAASYRVSILPFDWVNCRD